MKEISNFVLKKINSVTVLMEYSIKLGFGTSELGLYKD